jgi:hypothetical protein
MMQASMTQNGNVPRGEGKGTDKRFDFHFFAVLKTPTSRTL